MGQLFAMPPFSLQPIAFVQNPRTEPIDDDWDAIVSTITLAEGISPECLWGLDAFSHVEVVFLFDRVRDEDVVWSARHPRNNKDWPKVGMFAQRGKNRPNRLAVSVARVESVAEGKLTVRGLDAIDGTPILDIKPVMREFLPRGAIRQPAWSNELMRQYWSKGG